MALGGGVLLGSHENLGGGFKDLLFSPRKMGKIPILAHTVFFRWVETTNQE